MTTKLMKGLNYLVMFVLLNILWLIGIVIGLFFGGLLPSTYALIAMYRDTELFDGFTSYRQISKRFFVLWWKGFKHFKFSVLLFPVAIFIVYLDILLVQQDQLMKAMFLWPLIALMCYLGLSMVQFAYTETVSGDSIKAKLKAALVAPLLMPLESLLSMLVFGSFFVLCLRFNWLFFVFAAALLFVICKMLQNGYEKKGLVMHD